MAQKMAAVGWRGITLKVPSDWSLVGVDGDEKKGYFRVDGPIASILEVRWSAVTGPAPDLEVKAREFLATLEKSCRKNKIKFSSKIKTEKNAENSVGFRWRADRLGHGRIVHCEKCSRVIIAQIVADRDENVSHAAPAMLDSLTDHRDDGWTDWALYEFQFAAPPGYRLDKHTLMSGYLSLMFKGRGGNLVVERWGLAQTTLADDTLAEWYRKDATPCIRGYRFDLVPQEVKGHEGLRVAGRSAGIKQASRALLSSLTLHGFPRVLTGYVWHCSDTNRLFSIRAAHSTDADVAEEVCRRITCH